MDAVTLIFIGLALGQCVLLALLAARDLEQSLPRSLLHVLLLGVGAYLLTPLIPSPFLVAVQTLVPGVLWLLCASLFDDRFRLAAWQVGLVATTVVLPQLGRLAAEDSRWDWLFLHLPQALELVLLALGLVVVARHWRDDLVQARRRLRWLFTALVGGYTFVLVLARELLFGSENWFVSAQYGVTALVLVAASCLVFSVRGGIFPAGSQSLAPAPQLPVVQRPVAAKPEVDNAILQGLEQLMTGERIYREMGLTIGQLATTMGVPQYRLRQAINTGLGYRNFNDFLNSYRVREAARRLVSRQDHGLPVLNIALDAGFRSLSAFNRAFKLTYDMTPTEYRQRRAPAA